MTRIRFVMLAGLATVALSPLWLLNGSGAANGASQPLAPALRPLPPPQYDGTVASLKHPTLSSHLILLADAAARAEAAGLDISATSPALPAQLAAMAGADRLRFDDGGLVQVYVHVDGSRDVAGALTAAGADVERVEDELGIIQAWVPATNLASISLLPGVLRVRLPDYPVLNAGSEQTEGDAVMNADDIRKMFGVDGSGFTVGVISDGAGDVPAAQATGNLPPGVDLTTCNVVGQPPGNSGREGTAMMEIVHDIVPGAGLMFGNFGFATSLDFNDAVDCLAANTDVVVDDIGWFGVGHYDGTGSVSQNTSDALNGPGSIRAYFTSVGNQADRHYQGDYADSGMDYVDLPSSWRLHAFSSGGPLATKHSNLHGSPSPYNRFILSPGGSATIIVVWDDPNFSAAINDYDLFIFDGPDAECIGGDFQGGPGTSPIEGCSVGNGGGTDIAYDIVLGNYLNLQSPVEFDLFLLCSGCDPLANGNRLDFTTYNSSVANQGDAGGGVISVGAVDVDEPGNDEVEFFSSIGPTNDGRMKPDVSAPDGVSTTTQGFFTFFGTSAAAPHAAGVAALLLDCNGSLNRTTLRGAILDHADDIESPGPDQLSGTGHIDALASANAVGCGGAPPPATATPTATSPGPTATATNTSPAATATPTHTPPGCAADAYEDNDSDLTPAVVGLPFNVPGLTACPDDEDWYSFQSAAGQTIEIEALFSHSQGDVDIYLFDPFGFVVDASVSVTNNEAISFATLDAGKYLLLVDLYEDFGSQPGNTYTLSIEKGAAIIYGDANCSGATNSIDATIILQLTAALLNALPCPDAADVNGDGLYNAVDATIILQFVAGFIGTLPV